MVLKSASMDQEIWRDWISTRDPHAGDSLLRKYMPLVSYHVHRIAVGLPQGVNKDDLRSFGMIGLYDALEKFDPSRDLKFDTYASFRVRGAILDGLRKEDWLPRSIREKSKKIEAVTETLEQQHMRSVTAKEIGETLGMTEEEVHSTVVESLFGHILSVDDHKDTDDAVGFSIKDNSIVTPEEEMIKRELFDDLASVVKKLNDKEQLVISLFYQEELTLTEIGQVMNLSTSRISQIHSKALFKLRTVLEKILL